MTTPDQTTQSRMHKLVVKVQPEYPQDIPVFEKNLKRLINSCIPKKKTGFREMSQSKWDYSKGFNDAVESVRKQVNKL